LRKKRKCKITLLEPANICVVLFQPRSLSEYLFSRTGIMLFAARTLFFLNLKTLWHRIAYKGRKEERGLTNDEVKDTRCERLPQPRYPDHPSSLPRRRQSPHGPPWPGPCARTQTAFHQSRAGHLAGALDPALVGSTASTLIKSLAGPLSTRS